MAALRSTQMAVGSPHTSARLAPTFTGDLATRRQERAVFFTHEVTCLSVSLKYFRVSINKRDDLDSLSAGRESLRAGV